MSNSESKDPILSQVFLFILSDEVLPSGKLVRKVVQIPKNQAQYILSNPEKYGINPPLKNSAISIGEHALGNNVSHYTSASTFPKGAPNFTGRPVYIDINKLKSAGAIIHSSEEIIADLNRLVKANPSLEPRVKKLIYAIKHVEGEVLIQGNIPASAVKSSASMGVTRGLRYVQAIGFAITAYDISMATKISIETKSAKPITAETIRQAGGWGSAVTGMKIGGMLGAAVGIETGPGAIVTGAVGAFIFGAAGYFGADWIADYIYEN